MRNFSIDLVWAKVQTAAATIGGYLGYFVGGVDGLMTALMSAKLYGAKHSSQAAGKCEHTNVWGFPYFAWWDKLESVHLWIRYKDRFLRCVRVRVTNLRIDTSEDASASYSPGEQLWGYPHILEYRQPYHFNRMYEVEKTYETEDSLLYDLAHYDGSIELTTWLDDLKVSCRK